VQLQHCAAEHFPDQTAAAFPFTPALATPEKPAFHQVSRKLQEPEQQTAAAAVLALGPSSKLVGRLALLL